MKIFLHTLLFVLVVSQVLSQSLAPLTVEKIMRDPRWIGTSPTGIAWSPDSKTVYFNWNPDQGVGDSLYAISVSNKNPRKVNRTERQSLPSRITRYNKANTKFVYEKNGDIFLFDVGSGQVKQITNTVARESNPYFSGDEKKIYFTLDQNTYRWEITTGSVQQITDFRKGKKAVSPAGTEQDRWLKKDQLTHIEVLRERNTNQELTRKNQRADQPKRPKEIYLDDKTVEIVQVSPDEKFITFRLTKSASAKTTIVPNYVTPSGFTENLQTRSKVGAPLNQQEFFVYDIVRDTVLQVKTDQIPGITDIPEYRMEYATKEQSETKEKKPQQRAVAFSAVNWSDDGKHAVVVVRALDYKDRWIILLNPATQELTLLDRQHDDAWIGGPTIGGFGDNSIGWLADNKRLWFTSEESGYTHLYTIDVNTKIKQALTSGKYEVQSVQLSRNKNFFYLTTNEVHPGEKHFYRLSIAGGKLERITTTTGAHEVTVSPDEKTLAIRYAYSTKPWELFVMENKPGAKLQQITNSVTTEFTSYNWRDPEVITIKARDEANVYARLYKPTKVNGAAVVFVHGAGYLQNAHKWWSSYFREYMFHNLLVDQGYTVLDIDYRGSAGYGRDWRTGIYRHMGGKDLTDHVDAAKWLTDTHGIDASRIGIYGGSYGGFITLMALFTTPDVFAAGAALRPVTDWAHYNHPYTANILNVPYQDSIAYAKSSPIYFAEGLQGALLICHGMVDVNVHFQDVVRLSQRLIELKKDNWELAVYPMEDHGFVEPSSWTDEYKRILKLFDQHLLTN